MPNDPVAARVWALAGPARVSRAPETAAANAACDALETRVGDLLDRMTLAEKIGQMAQVNGHEGSVSEELRAAVAGGRVGAILNEVHLPTANELQRIAVEESRLGIPLLMGRDVIHGFRTILPIPLGQAASFNPELARQGARMAAQEAAAAGINWSFAPMLDITRDPRWGRVAETFGEDPYLFSRFAEAMVRGLQGDDLARPGSIAACAKHFAGYGASESGRDYNTTNIPEIELRNLHLPTFRAALDAGAATFMSSFSALNGVPASANRFLLRQVLREEWGFDGFVVSDWNGFKQVADCRQEACQLSINAGVDMLMIPDDWQEVIGDLVSLVEDGQIPMSRIDDAVTRILRVKARAGLLDPAKPSVRPDADPAVVGCAAHREIARRAVRQSLVMLKNRGGILPLDPSLHVLVAGDGADDIGKQSGGWTLTWQGTENENGDFPGASSIYDGISAAVANAGGRATLSPDGGWSERPDVAVVVFGEDPYAEGQGDRAHLSFSALYPEGLALLRKLKSEGIPVVSVFLTGRPLWVNPELNASDAFVVAWLPGSEGVGVSDVLFRTVGGEIAYDFTGRLAFSWPRSSLQATVNRNDPEYDPLFPYGFGLGAADVDTLSDELIEEDEAPSPAGDESIGILTGRVVPPFEFYIGDSQAWKVPVRGRSSRSPTGAVTVTNVDHYSQEDARRISWDGSGGAQVYFQRSAGQDLSSHASRGARLRCKLRVDVRPQGRVELRMDSGYPQSASIDITDMLHELPLGSWEDVAFEMSAFADGTDNLCSVDTPWLIWTDGLLGLSVSNLRIDPGDD